MKKMDVKKLMDEIKSAINGSNNAFSIEVGLDILCEYLKKTGR